MPWKDLSVDAQRYELVQLYLAGGASMVTLAARFGVTPKTGYKWVNAYRVGGTAALTDRSRRPHTSPRQTSDDQVATVLALADRHPTWGGTKLHDRLCQLGVDPVPAPSTIAKILRRAGRERRGPTPTPADQRFVRDAPNELWQLDFKGSHTLRAGTVIPLSLLDDHSRYALVLEALDRQVRPVVQAILTRCFEWYGLPWELLADNGPPWGTSEPGARTGLDIWLMQLGIRVIHGRAHHPQTQGKIERFHRTLKADVFAGPPYRDLAEAQIALDRFRQVYNHERPHAALEGHLPPGRVYTISPRPFPDRIAPPTYADEAAVRRVSADGTIRYAGRIVRVGTALAGLDVGVYPTTTDGVVRMHFYRTTIREVDLHRIPHA